MVPSDVTACCLVQWYYISDCMFRTFLHFENYGNSIFRNVSTYITHIVVSYSERSQS